MDPTRHRFRQLMKRKNGSVHNKDGRDGERPQLSTKRQAPEMTVKKTVHERLAKKPEDRAKRRQLHLRAQRRTVPRRAAQRIAIDPPTAYV